MKIELTPKEPKVPFGELPTGQAFRAHSSHYQKIALIDGGTCGVALCTGKTKHFSAIDWVVPVPLKVVLDD